MLFPYAGRPLSRFCVACRQMRLEKEVHEETQSKPYVKPMDITGKIMKGWARNESAGFDSDDGLKAWAYRAVKFARSLPPKQEPVR